MYKKIAYIIVFIIFFGVLFFSMIVSDKVENTTPVKKVSEPLTEQERIEIIFKEEFSESQNPVETE